MPSPSDQLVATRWLASQAVLPAGPDINNFEAVVKLITGIPYASVITNGLGLDAACRFTAIRPFKSTTGDIGIRLRVEGGAAGSQECAILLGRTDGKLHVYANNGPRPLPYGPGASTSTSSTTPTRSRTAWTHTTRCLPTTSTW